MKIGCISVKNDAFLKDFKTMSNFENCKNMEIMRVEKKIICKFGIRYQNNSNCFDFSLCTDNASERVSKNT